MEIIDVYMRLRDGVSNQLAKIRNNMAMTARQQDTLGRNVQNVGRHISGIGETLAPVSAGIVAAGGLIGRTFVGFDATVTKAGAKAGATAEQLEQMRVTAGKLGAEFPISATEAAQAMDGLAAAGYDANQIMAMLPSVIQSSVASGEDLAMTSEVVSSALNTWNLQTGDVEKNTLRVADVIQQANNMSALSLQDFGLAMQYAGAPAAALGIQIEDLSAAMAIMRNKGLAASNIGTSLRSMFSRLADPPKEAAVAIEQLGMQIQDANGNFVGMENIVGQMRTAMAGMNNVQRIAYAQAIAGTDGYSGLLALLDSAPETYHRMTTAMYNASGSSAKQFAIMKESVKGSIDDMMGSLESFSISMGDVLKPIIKDVTASIAAFADALNALSPEQKRMIADVAMGIVGFTGLSLVTGKVITAGGSLIRTWADVRKVLAGGAISNKALQYSIRGIQSAVNVAVPALSSLKGAAGAAVTAMRGATFTSVGASMTGGARTAVSGIGAGLRTAMTGIVGAMKGISLSGIGAGLGKAFTGIASGIRAVAMAGRFLVATPMGLAIMAIAGAALLLYKNWDKVGPFFMKLWSGISAAFGKAWSMIGPALNKLVTAVSMFFNKTASGQNILGKLIGLMGGLAKVLGAPLLVAFQAHAGVVAAVFSGIIQSVGAAIAMIINVISGIITFVTDVFAGDWEGAWNAVVDIFSSIIDGVKGIFEGVISAIKGSLNALISAVNSISVDIPSWVPVVGGQHYSPSIPMLAHGSDDWGGGPAMVHDKGAEIIDIPRHGRVIPHDRSLQEAFNMGAQSAGGVGGGITIMIANATIGNVQDAKALARQVAEEIEFELRKRSVNLQKGAI